MFSYIYTDIPVGSGGRLGCCIGVVVVEDDGSVTEARGREVGTGLALPA